MDAPFSPLLSEARASGGKARLLFVDDDELVLQGLRRSLRRLRGEWEMEFHASPAEAVEAMERGPFDVVVSDIRMPGMNGAVLLGEAARIRPEAVRLVLSGCADPVLALRCADVAHHCLPKPCDAGTLVETIRRTLAVREALDDEGVRRLVSRVESLPSKPDLYLEMVCRLQDPGVEIAAIAEVIQRDAAMAAKVLKLVNSAFFGHPRRMANIADAVGFLGLDTIRSLVLAIDVLEPFRDGGGKGRGPGVPRPGDMWEHGYHVACAAREIARREQAPQRVVDEAFAAGLLHDAGKLIFARNFPEEYASCLAGGRGHLRGELSCAEEERLFGASHPLAGAYLFGLWGLPAPVVEAVAFHHAPGRSPGRGFTALTAVHVADALVHRLASGGRTGEDDPLDRGYLKEIGLEGRLAAWEEVV